MNIDVGFDAVIINGTRLDEEVHIDKLTAICGGPPRRCESDGNVLIWDDLGINALYDYDGKVSTLIFFPIGKAWFGTIPGKNGPSATYKGGMSFVRHFPSVQAWKSWPTKIRDPLAGGPSKGYLERMLRPSGLFGIDTTEDCETGDIDTFTVFLRKGKDRAHVATNSIHPTASALESDVNASDLSSKLTKCRDCNRCTESYLTTCISMPFRAVAKLLTCWNIDLFRRQCPRCGHRMCDHTMARGE